MNRRNKLLILIPIILLSLFGPGFPQARRPAKSPSPAKTRPPFLQQAKSFEETPYITKLVLRNGLTILVEERRTQPVVAIQTHVRAGSFHEPAQNVGGARLLAAMLERGGGEKPGGTLRQNAHALGGIIRRSVDYENTCFEIVVPASQWKQALNLQVDRLFNFSIDTDGLDSEIHRILNEARDALDDPGETAKEALLEMALGQPRMKEHSEMTIDALKNLKKEKLREFYEAMYAFPRITLVVSGDVTPSDVFNEVVRKYGKPRASATKSASIPILQTQERFQYRAIHGDTAIPGVFIGFQAVPENSDDFRALEVLAAVLGLGEGSVLNARLRDQMGLIWTQETQLLTSQSFGYFMIRMEADSEKIDRSELAALTEIELLKRRVIDKADLIRAQAQLELEYWKHQETASGRAETLARYESLGSWKRANSYTSEIKKVEASDIRRVVNKYFGLDRCSILEILPISDPARSTTREGMLQTFEGLLESSADQEQARREKEVVPFMKIPETVEIFKFSEVQYPFQMASILRGPDMFVREDHTAPLIEMGLFFRGGKLAEKSENAGITRLMTQLMLRGTKDMPASQFHRQIEIYGARMQPMVFDDYFGVMFSILSSNFAAGFNLLQQTIKTPEFDKASVDRLKGIQKGLIFSRGSSGAMACDLVKHALFSGSSYSRNGLGTESSLAGITPEGILEWHSMHVKNRKPFVVIIGDSKGTGLAAHFVKHFSGSRMKDGMMPEEWTKALGKSEAVEEKWGKDQSLILLGFQAPPLDDEDAGAVSVLEDLVGNENRLPQATRENLAGIQRLSAVYKPKLRGGSLIIYAEAAPGSEAEAFEAVKNALQSLVKEPVSYREFSSAVRSTIGRFEIMNQGRKEQILRITESLLAGKGIDAFVNFPIEVQKVKAEDIADIAQRILNLEKAVVVRIHGQANR